MSKCANMLSSVSECAPQGPLSPSSGLIKVMVVFFQFVAATADGALMRVSSHGQPHLSHSLFLSTKTLPTGWLCPCGAENRECWGIGDWPPVMISSSSAPRSLLWCSAAFAFLPRDLTKMFSHTVAGD